VSDSLLLSSDKDAQIASLQALLAERDASLAEAKAELLHRDMLIETMRVQLARLRRVQFGASSEKLSAEIAQLELALEELEAAAPVAQASTVPPKLRRCGRCPTIFPARMWSLDHPAGRAPALIAVAAYASWVKTAPSSLMWHLFSGASCAPSGPSIAAGCARRLFRHPPL
jgi:hypothetical protein